MAFLLVASAFFSSSEAAFFSLGHVDRKHLAAGGRLARLANSLLNQAEPLLTTILLGNLLVNFTFFASSTVILFQLQQEKQYAIAGAFASASLLIVIIFSEMLPKDIGILARRPVAVLCAFPLSMFLHFLRPALFVFEWINRLSLRLFFPHLKKEPYLRVDDLEQALELSQEEASLQRQEHAVLQNILFLSKIRAEELMRPRTHLRFFKPPVTLEQIWNESQGERPKIEYLLISEKESDELSSAVSLRKIEISDDSPAGGSTDSLKEFWQQPWDENSAPVVYVPWNLSVANTLDVLCKKEKEVAAILNEYGETLGILTLEDIIETAFGRQSSRSRRLLNRSPITQIAPGVWHLTGLTNLRRLEKYFHIKFPSHSSVTIAGFLQEQMEHLPKRGDSIEFAQMRFLVLDISETDGMLIEISNI